MSTTPTDWKHVADLDALPIGRGTLLVVDGLRLALFRTAQAVHAMDDHCPHAGASLAGGLFHKDIVACPLHHWRFCVKTGTYLDNPRHPARALILPVEIRDGRVWVDFGPLRANSRQDRSHRETLDLS